MGLYRLCNECWDKNGRRSLQSFTLVDHLDCSQLKVRKSQSIAFHPTHEQIGIDGWW